MLPDLDTTEKLEVNELIQKLLDCSRACFEEAADPTEDDEHALNEGKTMCINALRALSAAFTLGSENTGVPISTLEVLLTVKLRLGQVCGLETEFFKYYPLQNLIEVALEQSSHILLELPTVVTYSVQNIRST